MTYINNTTFVSRTIASYRYTSGIVSRKNWTKKRKQQRKVMSRIYRNLRKSGRKISRDFTYCENEYNFY